MKDAKQALATEKEARDVAEDARETEWEHPSFAAELFLGRFRSERAMRIQGWTFGLCMLAVAGYVAFVAPA